MIKELNDINNFKCFGDVFSIKIYANLLAYSQFNNISKFWIDESAVYNLWGDNLTVSGKSDNEFVKFLSPKTVLCSENNATGLCLKSNTSGQVLIKNKNNIFNSVEVKYENNLKDVFLILNKCNMIDSYEEFMLDMSHKLRRGLASYINIENKAVALSSYVCDSAAIITAVASMPSYRKEGHGSTALKALEQKLSGRDLYIFKEDKRNDSFYIKNGYKTVDNWILGDVV